MKKNKFWIVSRLKSFGYAFNGLKILFIEEHNARIHLLATVLVTLAGFWLHISSTEWLAILIVFGLVLSLEAVNSALEGIANFVSPQRHNEIKKIKDLAAAGVLIAVIIAVFCGLIVFLPKVMRQF